MFNFIFRFISNQFANPQGIFGSFSTFIMNRLNKKQYSAILNNIKITDEDIILDIGFGNGYLIKKILSEHPKKIFGIDVSEDMVNKTKMNLKKVKNNELVNVEIGDVKCLPYENEFFNKIYTVNTVYFWNDMEKSFSEIKRTLKTNGIFINVIYSKEWLSKLKITDFNFNKYDINEIKECTENCGLKISDIVEIENQKSYCIISKKS